MVYRCILPNWVIDQNPSLTKLKIVEGAFSEEKLLELNEKLYNIYFLPNYPSVYDPSKAVNGSDIDMFRYVFVDMDLKDGVYKSKAEFIETITITPTLIVDSGNGVHVYWAIDDLNPMAFLRLQRRLVTKFNTDPAVCKLYQLMRVPNTVNTKKDNEFKLCTTLVQNDISYTAEEFSKLLPPITPDDEEYCKFHYNQTYNIASDIKVDDRMPPKFSQLLRDNIEVQEIWKGNTDDRSASDYRLGHLMFANDFTKEEALSVLVNSAKALTRGPKHRINYANNIVEKIWTFELVPEAKETLSMSVREILQKGEGTLKGTRFSCWRYLDATHHGFRLGQVIGLVAGSGVGKTAMALNMFQGFVQNNPDYEHFFIPLEQPQNEIADRWKTMCGTNTHLYDKVHLISNYAQDGTFRHLSFDDIKDYLLEFQKKTGKKVGCVVIDHIGALKKKGRDGENQDLMDICHRMKAFAIETNTLLVMQSQAPREKAGIGDLELNKDAAYGTVYFESYCDYLITIWQPLKRCYDDAGCPTVTAFKFCKIRHKKKTKDEIQEDVCYRLFFDPDTEHLRELTQKEEISFDFFNKKAVNIRKLDRKTDVIPYKSMPWTQKDSHGSSENNQDS